MIDLRLRHDDAALAQLRAAGKASAEMHVAAMRATRPGGHETGIAAVILGELKRRGLVEAYGSIVTVHGEVLHNEAHVNPLADGDLLLVRLQEEAVEGDIVIAYVGDEGEATVKRFRRQGKRVFLQADNAKYAPILKPFKVAGRVTGLIRTGLR
jgi:SOS-response transcriptional repressor LexA